jgi:four helix bundle protein
MHNYKELIIWKSSRELVKEIYLITSTYPEIERFGLVSQMRRCCISIPSNIAEGSGRTTDKDFANFLSISISSAFELETQLLVSYDLGFINNESLEKTLNKIAELQKMIFGFRNKLIIKN